MTLRKRWKRALLLAVLASGVLGLTAMQAAAQTPVTGTDPDFPRGRFSGYIFGDYYYNGPGRDRAKAIEAFEQEMKLGSYANTNSLGTALARRREFARAGT